MGSENETLWMLSYEENGWNHLRAIYAKNQTEAWQKAMAYAREHGLKLPSTAHMLHYPQGFKGAITQPYPTRTGELPGNFSNRR